MNFESTYKQNRSANQPQFFLDHINPSPRSKKGIEESDFQQHTYSESSNSHSSYSVNAAPPLETAYSSDDDVPFLASVSTISTPKNRQYKQFDSMSPSSYRGMSYLNTDSHSDYPNEYPYEDYSSYQRRMNSNPYLESNHDSHRMNIEFHSNYDSEREDGYSTFRDFRTPTHSSSYGVRNQSYSLSMSPVGRQSSQFRSDFNEESSFQSNYTSDYSGPPFDRDYRSGIALPVIMTNLSSDRDYHSITERDRRDSYYSQSPSYHRSSLPRKAYENDVPLSRYDRADSFTESRYDRAGSFTENRSGYYVMSASPQHGRSVGGTPRNGMGSQGFTNSSPSHDGFLSKFLASTSPHDFASVERRKDDSSEEDYIACLKKNYHYRTILRQTNIQQYRNKSTSVTASEEDKIRVRIDDGIEKKKNCQFRKARTVFIELVLEYPHCLQIWLEFTRLEMECGEYHNAAIVLNAALLQHKHNELLLQKKIRVEERLRRIKPITDIINELKTIDTQKSLKIIMEAIASIARMGYERRAIIYYRKIVQVSRFFTGNFFMELMLFEEHYGDYEKLMGMIPIALGKYPKYGPLWFYCFELEEHDCMTKWKRHDLNSRISFNRYEEYMKKAVSCLTSDLLWKVYFIRIQFWYRSILYLRAATQNEFSLLSELFVSECRLWKAIEEDTSKCLEYCPTNLKWKFFMILGRFAAISGYQAMSTKLFAKALSYSPEKSKQQVLLDYSKAEFFINNFSFASGILTRAKTLFPTEWKIELERIQQLVQKGYSKEALVMNYDALRSHIGAGRLWASCIQLTHQLFGPETALKVFKRSLRHVAKSGEVWCEGCRIFLNPCSSLFSPKNALKCLNYAIFFTPQYGDSFIEIIRFMMISSDTFLALHSIPNPSVLAHILSSYTPVLHFIKRYSFYNPNYGPLWFRCKEFLLAPAKEVLYRAVHIVALEIAMNADLYYEALKYRNAVSSNRRVAIPKAPSALRARFNAAIPPDHLYERHKDSNSYKRKVQLLYGASQMDY